MKGAEKSRTIVRLKAENITRWNVGGDEMLRAWGTDHRLLGGRSLAGMIPRQKRKSQSRSLGGIRQLTKRYVWLVVDGED
jgi:hypothetical protein